MYRNSLLTALLPLILLLVLAACARQGADEAHVRDFSVIDAPHDDGTGITLKWRPLDKSQRIIQYNIYRGHRPDSLFLLSKIEVDPKVGVASQWLSFTDRDYLPLVEFETAPARLRPEKQQTATAKLFKPVPRDAEIVASLLPHYTLMGDINAASYYKSSRRVALKGTAGENVHAGYRLTQFNNIYANPKAEHQYHYCVVPVAETGHFLPATPVLSATPVNNRPDSTAVLHTAYLADTREFRFEWTPPLGSTDIMSWSVWLMPKTALPQYRSNQAANSAAPDSVFNANWQRQSILLHEMQPAYWSQVFYDKARPADNGVQLPPDGRLADYLPVLVYSDYWASEDGSREQSFSTAALGEKLQFHNTRELPMLPDYQVLDKPNDKGDNMIVSFGRPFAFVTQATYTNKAKRRLRINYEISGNGYQEIDRLRFEFLDDSGQPLGQVMELYPDKIIRLRLPEGFKPGTDIQVRVFARVLGEKDFGPQALEQRIVYDETAIRYAGGDAFWDGQNLNRNFYDIFSRNKLSPTLSPGMRIGALSRNYDHTISFPATQYPAITGYDPASGLLLTDHQFTVAMDPEQGVAWVPSLYRQDAAAYLDTLAAGIAGLKKQIAPGDSTSEAALELAAKEAERDFILSQPAYQQAAAAKSDRAWRRVLLAELDRNSRSYTYGLLATNGKGLWSDEADLPPQPGQPADRNTVWHYPVAQWFDRTKLATLIASLIMGVMVVYALVMTRRKDLYIRPIAGLEELDNAVGRATEMGRPVMFVPGWGTLGEPCTISAMMILNQIAKKTAEYDIRLISPHVDYFVVPLAQEMVQTAYSEMGRPDAYNNNDIFFVSDTQFAFCAAVNGITVRERIATIFYMGYFYAEALLMTETGNQSGAIQIAASDAITQIPFFITTCDYTLIGEEFYAASAYLSRNVELVSMLKAQDYFKILIVITVLVGVVLSTLHNNTLLNFLPFE